MSILVTVTMSMVNINKEIRMYQPLKFPESAQLLDSLMDRIAELTVYRLYVNILWINGCYWWMDVMEPDGPPLP